VAQGGLIFSVLFILYVNEMPSSSNHVELAVYADDTTIIATSCKPTLLVSCLLTFRLYCLGRQHNHLHPSSYGPVEAFSVRYELIKKKPYSTEALLPWSPCVTHYG